MDNIVDGADKFLKYGPLGFSALIFVVVVIALLTGRANESRDKMLRLVVFSALFVYSLAAILAFASEQFARPTNNISVAHSLQLQKATEKTHLAISNMKTLPALVSGSCNGGPHGINPSNYGDVVNVASQSADAMVSVYGTLQGLIALAPPVPAPTKAP
ncbi:hypothetical protein [Rhizobium rhizogenes]|uniref:hypothetical protein n=1 Tax=Rhizobium rhizogenes TaxID=359 RepID=UPI0022C9DFD6|nr:hypothetical protein [Rhizobium rhizogenes]MCZ7480545.1 hypothetical protein [Rhizobium rhizogenes]